MTRVPVGWTTLTDTVPVAVAVALALMTKRVASAMAVIVAPAGIPGPVTLMPGTRPRVLATTTLAEPLVVDAPVSVPLAKDSVERFRLIRRVASGRSSMRPPPFWTARVETVSVVLPAEEPRKESRPPCMLTKPPTPAPRRLSRLSVELSSSNVPPTLTLRVDWAELVETKAAPLAPA